MSEIYQQSLAERQELLVKAARAVAMEESKNPHLSKEDQAELSDYAFDGKRSELIDAFIQVHKQRILDRAFPYSFKTSKECIAFFRTVEQHVPEKIRAYAIAGGHFVGIDNHSEIFQNTWKAYGEKCKREQSNPSPVDTKG